MFRHMLYYCAHLIIPPPVSNFAVSQLPRQWRWIAREKCSRLDRARLLLRPTEDQMQWLLLVYESISPGSNTNVVHWNTDKLFYPLHIAASSLGKFMVTSNWRNVTLPPRQHLVVDLKHKTGHIRDERYVFLVSYTCLNCHFQTGYCLKPQAFKTSLLYHVFKK